MTAYLNNNNQVRGKKYDINKIIECVNHCSKIIKEEIIKSKDYDHILDLSNKLGETKVSPINDSAGKDFKFSNITLLAVENDFLIGKQSINEPKSEKPYTEVYSNKIQEIGKDGDVIDEYFDDGSSSCAHYRFEEKYQYTRKKKNVIPEFKFPVDDINSNYNFSYMNQNSKLPSLIEEFYLKHRHDPNFFRIDEIYKFHNYLKEKHGPYYKSEPTVRDQARKIAELEDGNYKKLAGIVENYEEKEKELVKPNISYPISKKLAFSNLAFVLYLSGIIISSNLKLYQNINVNLYNLFQSFL